LGSSGDKHSKKILNFCIREKTMSSLNKNLCAQQRSGVQRRRGKWGDAPYNQNSMKITGHPRLGGIQKVKLQKLKCCS